MKSTAFILLLAVSLALGALVIHQNGQLRKLQTENGALQGQLKEAVAAAEKAQAAEHKASVLQNALNETAADANAQTRQVADLQSKLAAAKTNALAGAGKGTNGFAALASMFKDPKMKEMIKNQQKAVMGPMIEKQYSALFKQLNLSPEDSATLKDLLTKKMLAGANSGMSMMDGSLDASQRADLTKQMKSEMDGYDSQIKEFLGENNFPAFQSYEKTVPDRMVVGQFNDQLAGGDNAMTADQQEQLAQAMNEARSSFKWTTDYTDQSKLAANGDMAAMFTEDKINQFLTEKEQFDQQFLSRAQQILTPEQAKNFAEFQKTQRDMQAMGMKMAASMFGSKGQGN